LPSVIGGPVWREVGTAKLTLTKDCGLVSKERPLPFMGGSDAIANS
jgi:hypothetical protein